MRAQSLRRRALQGGVVAALLLGAPGGAQAAGGLTVAPGTAAPGQPVHIEAGLPAPATANDSFCLAMLGPSGFRRSLGLLATDSRGQGQVDVHVPADSAAGAYQVAVGPCGPHHGIAPAQRLATATLTVLSAAPGSPPGAAGLGGAAEPEAAAAAGLLLALAAAAGLACRRVLRR